MAHMGQPVGAQLVLDESGGGDDTLLPTQFWMQVGDPRSEPEKRLMVAVVEEAMSVILNAGGSCEDRRTAVREARQWFASDDRGSLFCFASICDVLGLEAPRVRQALAAWERRQNGFRRPRLQAGRGRHQVGAPRRAA
jgi:hypothetical protein